MRTISLRQRPAPLIIGERVNAAGSRKAKRLILADDYEGLVDIARDQAQGGAHCLDVCVAVTERADEKEFMVKLVKQLSLEVETPLVIDSTDPVVIEAAVRHIPGKPIINSINLEGDGSRFSGIAPVMKKYGLPAIAMCIGPQGMTKTARQKMSTAELLVETGKKYDLQEWQYIFDPLTFTLATGEDEFLDSANQTIEGIRLIKERFPQSYTVLGLSNVSFGLDPYPRKVINSVFFYHAVQAGLDCVIVNPTDIIPYANIPLTQKRAADDLVLNRRPDALAKLLDVFEGLSSEGPGAAKPTIDPAWPASKKANYMIVNRILEGIEREVVQAIHANMDGDTVIQDGQIQAPLQQTHPAAIQVLNESLLPAMKTVGDRFGAGEIILPFVLKSAECMKSAVSELEKYLLKKEGASKGKLVLGTVYGDVHDIGKNLVKTIFQNNGYAVYDLGKQVPMQRFLDKIQEVDADAVGLSALLVNTSREMKHFVDHARDNDLSIPILCGGAAINTSFVNRISTDNGIYDPGVFYCNTMFDGLKVMDRLMSEPDILRKEWRNKLEKYVPPTRAAPAAQVSKSDVRAVKPPRPPFMGRTILQDVIDYQQVWSLVDQRSLFKLSWGLRGMAGREQAEEHQRLYLQWQEKIRAESLFAPTVTYGYFQCHSRGNWLVIRSDDRDTRLAFPRSQKARRLCMADYFGKEQYSDVVIFQAVSAGSRAEEIISKWNEEGRITDAYYLHGLAVEFVEALAEWNNRRIRTELGLDTGCLRYSWGYPSCPNIEQHELVWRLLHPDKAGMTLSASGQIIPDQSTAAIILHHPDAEYFLI